MPISPWPGRPWKPSARSTRCSTGKPSKPESPTIRRDKTPLLASSAPIFADLSGLPPLIIQAGSHEVLLDDAVRLAQQAATADVEVTLDITPGVPHVFQAYYPILDSARLSRPDVAEAHPTRNGSLRLLRRDHAARRKHVGGRVESRPAAALGGKGPCVKARERA